MIDQVNEYKDTVQQTKPDTIIDQTFGILNDQDSKTVTSEPVSEDGNDHRMEPKDIICDDQLLSNQLDQKTSNEEIKDDLKLSQRRKRRKSLTQMTEELKVSYQFTGY